MTNLETLIEKLNSEIESFRNSYNDFDVIQTYNDWYIIGFYEEYFDMFSCDFLENHNVEAEIEWLATKDNPLGYLYEKWTSSDGAFSHNWDDMLDFVCLVYSEEKEADYIKPLQQNLKEETNDKSSLSTQIEQASERAGKVINKDQSNDLSR